MKKLLLTMGALASTIVPIVMVVSCESEIAKNDETKKEEKITTKADFVTKIKAISGYDNANIVVPVFLPAPTTMETYKSTFGKYYSDLEALVERSEFSEMTPDDKTAIKAGLKVLSDNYNGRTDSETIEVFTQQPVGYYDAVQSLEKLTALLV